MREGDALERLLVGPRATEALARALAPRLERGDVLALWGELGVGKTSFARELIAALTGERRVPSPTFTLVQVYEGGPAPIWHFDLYRLKAPEDALELGLEDALAEAILLIEWPDRLGPLLPADRLDLALAYADAPDSRRVRLEGQGRWRARLAAIAADLDMAT